MQRRLSSALTFFYKVVFSILWIGGFGFGTFMLFLAAMRGKNGEPPPPEIKWFFLLGLILGSAFIYWGCIRLKQVSMDEEALYISNYLKEDRILLRDIEDVRENRWINIHPVTITFRRDTGFGRSIVFMPKARWFSIWGSHPVVGEIQSAIAMARGVTFAPPKA